MVKSETGENFESHALTMMLAQSYSGFTEGLENLELGSSQGKVMEFKKNEKSWNFCGLLIMSKQILFTKCK